MNSPEKRSIGQRVAASLAAVSMLLVAAPASAAVMFAHFSGSVIAGTGATGANPTYDTHNFFRLGPSLIGTSFNATFRYDTDLGVPITNAMTDTRYGGPNWGCDACVSPILNASITINGITDHFNTSRDGSGNVSIIGDDPNTDFVEVWKQTFFYTSYFQGSSGNALQLFVLNAPTPLLLGSSYMDTNIGTFGPPDTYPFALGVLEGTDKNYRLALSPSTTELAPVPEPATWSLMIIGFGGAGAMLRNRRRVLARV